MRSFNDAKGRQWLVEVNVATVSRVRAIGVDLLDLEAGRVLQELGSDPVKLVNVLYLLCKDEADARGVNDVEFGRGMLGDAIAQAEEALWEGLRDFFPSRRTRETLGVAMEKSRKLAEILEAANLERARAFDPETAATVLRSGKSSGGSPASAASTPGP